MKVSDSGISFIMEWERYAPEAYNDGAGYMTQGYGHRIKEGDKLPQRLTPQAAKALFLTDLTDVETIMDDAIEQPVTQEQFDAVCSLAFNIGCNAFKRSTLLAKINKGDYRGAAAQFDRWVFAGHKKLAGLVLRRKAERNIFENGTYNAEH